MSECRNWYNGDPILEEYHDHEWCKISHDDDFQFQMLCLEGASVGLSWRIIVHKRAAYLAAFHGFIIDMCAAMSDEELEALRSDPGIIRNKNKIYSVRKNAQIVKRFKRSLAPLTRICGALRAAGKSTVIGRRRRTFQPSRKSPSP